MNLNAGRKPAGIGGKEMNNNLLINAKRTLQRTRDRATGNIMRQLIKRVEDLEGLILRSRLDCVPQQYAEVLESVMEDTTDITIEPEKGPIRERIQYEYDEKMDIIISKPKT
ncbi:MAG: hypothetical protein KJO91_04210 [Gammaproteobacteria bacterium]|nr:hypothetical protein [Gammaproteobacteria bacterium]